MLVLLTGCRGGEGEALRLRATVIRSGKDTIRFALPALARYCDDGRSLLLQAASPLGNGVLVRLRYTDSLASADYPIIAAGDTAAERGAMPAIRYMIRDVGHAFVVDSGAVELRRSRRALTARLRGSGLDGTVRTPVDAAFNNVPLMPADTVQCRYQP